MAEKRRGGVSTVRGRRIHARGGGLLKHINKAVCTLDTIKFTCSE